MGRDPTCPHVAISNGADQGDDPKAAGALIGALVDGTDGMPRITTAARWTTKPECFVNVSFTAAGLAALGITQAQLATFDTAFVRGAANPDTAKILGDVGTSGPDQWIGGLSNGNQVHVVLNLWVDENPSVLEAVTARLRAAFAGCMTELSAHDAQALPDNQVHFGYLDSISQPTVIGAPDRKCVAGFETFLSEYAAKAGIDREMLAAKVCGRWRNGNPLVLAPDTQEPVLPTPELNDFTYVNDQAPAQDDRLGLKCPIGSHLRRNNPRNEKVNGTDSAHHRIVRRAMPYGPAYDPAHPDPVPTPRGLIGYFINASLFNQFEFITGQWNLLPSFVKSDSVPGAPSEGNAYFNISGQDVFLGVNDPASSSFTLAASGEKGKNNTVLKGFPRLVITRGGAYCFLPSITGLRYLARLPAAS